MSKEISKKQHEANQRNAQLGGVKTQEGKDISRFNAIKHGILGKIMSPYEEEVFQHFLDQLYVELEPKGFVEEMLLERVALSYLRLYRVAKAEKEFMNHSLDNTGSIGWINDETSKVDSGTVEKLNEVFLRYETSIENRLYKALKELRLYRTS